MKKISAILVLVLCLVLVSCGKGGAEAAQPAAEPVQSEAPEAPAATVGEVPEEPETQAAEPEVPVEPEEPAAEPAREIVPLPEGGNLSARFEYDGIHYDFYQYNMWDEAMVYGAINAADAVSGETLWNYVTDPQYVGQLDNFTVIGPTDSGFVFTKEDTVYCLNPDDGILAWTVDLQSGWPTGYYAIDDSGNFYFPAYFSPGFTVISADGLILNEFDSLESIYGDPVDDGWCSGIFMGSDGNLRIGYCMEYPMTYVVDPATAKCLDQYPGTVSITEEDLVGCWKDNDYTGNTHVILTIADDLFYSMCTYGEDGNLMYQYEGYFQLEDFTEDVGDDWLVSHLVWTDDPYFADWETIGDYVVSYYYRDDEYGIRELELLQINNGDSVLSTYFEMTDVLLEYFEPMG